MLVVLTAGGFYFGFRSKAGDRELPVYLTGSERMVAGEEIYRKGEDAKVFTYPPFAAAPVMPMLAVPSRWQPAAWFAVNFFLLLAVVRALHRWACRDWDGAGPPRLALLWIAVALLAGRHVSSVFENQSHDLFVCAAVVFAAVLLGRRGRLGDLGAGVAAGAGAAFKATPLLFLELFVFARSWTSLVVLVVAAVGLTWLPDLVFPRDDGASWAMRWHETFLRGMDVGDAADSSGAWTSHNFLNQGLAGTMARLFTPPPAAQQSVFVLQDAMVAQLSPAVAKAFLRAMQLLVVVVVAIGALRLRAMRDVESPEAGWRRASIGASGLVACGMVLLSPMSSKQHFCVLVLPAVFCADRLLRGSRDPLLLMTVAASALLATASSKGVLGKDLGNLVLAWGSVTWATVLLMLATLRAMREGADATRHPASDLPCSTNSTTAR